MMRELTSAETSLARVSDISFQLDQYGLQFEDSLMNHHERMAAEKALLATRKTISVDEYNHLVERAEAGAAAASRLNAAAEAAPTQ